MKRIFLRVFLLSGVIMLVFAGGVWYNQELIIPVAGATTKDWNPKSFWYYPWGKSGTHKGIDIFAKKGSPVIAPCSGMVWYTGQVERGGKIVVLLGPGWRFHYFAHLDTILTSKGAFISQGIRIGKVGNTGNAAGKPPHLHYAIVSAYPMYWKADHSVQGWKKMYYLDPNELLTPKSTEHHFSLSTSEIPKNF